MRNVFARVVLVAGGIFYTMSGVALFFAPQCCLLKKLAASYVKS